MGAIGGRAIVAGAATSPDIIITVIGDVELILIDSVRLGISGQAMEPLLSDSPQYWGHSGAL